MQRTGSAGVLVDVMVLKLELHYRNGHAGPSLVLALRLQAANQRLVSTFMNFALMQGWTTISLRAAT